MRQRAWKRSGLSPESTQGVEKPFTTNRRVSRPIGGHSTRMANTTEEIKAKETATTTNTIIAQLRALEQLTLSEEQLARAHFAQAPTDDVRRELQEKADSAERRTRRIVEALRDLGALPDVVTPAIGRVLGLMRGRRPPARARAPTCAVQAPSRTAVPESSSRM